jgi:hypothetical protein
VAAPTPGTGYASIRRALGKQKHPPRSLLGGVIYP